MREQSESLWRYHDFRTLWVGESISAVGSQVTLFALPLAAVVTLHATAADVGLLNAASFAPFLLFTLGAGVWVDRHRRRPVLIAADLGRAALLALIPLLAALGALRMADLYVIAFLTGILTVFFHLAYQSYLPALLPRTQLPDGNGKLFASESAAAIGGPGLGGLLVQLVTAPFALVVDIFSFVVSAVAMWRIRAAEPVPRPPAYAGSVLREIRDGLRFTFANPFLRAFAGDAATYNAFEQVIQSVLVLYAVRTLGMSPGLLGLLLAIGSAGGLLGALTTNVVARRIGVGPTVVVGSLISGVAPLGVPLASGSPTIVAVAFGFSFFAAGVGVTACNVHVVSLRQALTPDTLLGRMHASYRTITYGAIPFGALLGGALGSTLGPHATLIVGSCGLCTSTFWLFFSPVRRQRTLPSQPRQTTTPDTLGASTLDHESPTADRPEPVAS